MVLTELYNSAFNLVGNKYLFAALVFIVFFGLSKLVIFIIEKILMKLAEKTVTDVDDLILEAINGPISIILVLIGLIISAKVLGFVNDIFTKSINSVIIIIVAVVIIKIINILINDWGIRIAKKTKSRIDNQVLKLAKNVVIVVVWAFAGIFILQQWGIEIAPLLASLGIAGIAVAFALQSTLSNMFGGFFMVLDKTIKVGDVIEVDADTKGTVLDVGIRSTRIRTWNNEVIIIPSGKLADSKITNYVQPEDKVRVEVPFGVAYGSDIEKVKSVILKELPKVVNFIDDPEPHIKFLSMGDSSLNFKAYFFVNSYQNRFAALDDANTRVYNTLNKNKINIPFPQMDVHMKVHKKG